MLRRIGLIVASVGAAVALHGAPVHAQTQACGLSAVGGSLCVYSVKFICGTQVPITNQKPPVEPPVKPGNYATAVNIQNFHSQQAVHMTKRAVIANPENKPAGLVGQPREVGLKPFQALEVDCADIVTLLRSSNLPSFIKGFVVITSPVVLSVTAVYTAEQTGGNGKAPVSVEVVPQTPFSEAPVPVSGP